LHEISAAVTVEVEMEERQATEDIVSLSSTEERDRKLFMGDINKFMAEIGKPLSKIPIMGYKELDLYQLFKEVTAYGGFIEVVKNVGTWSKIWKRLGNFDPSITDSSFRLKKNYERYLLDYEYKCFPDHRQQAIELEKQMQLKKSQQSGELSPRAALGEAKKPIKSAEPVKPKVKKAKRKTYSGYKDIVREKSGCPKMPLCLGELTVECLGSIVPQSPYITEKHIWPVGFKSYRYFTSMNNPETRVKYTCQILEGGDKPQFVVTAEDDPLNAVISYSPSGAWRTVLKRVMGRSPSEEARKNLSVSGTLRFGLAHPIVSHLIRELPGADKCKDNGGSWSSSPSNSPSLGRKRRTEDDLSEGEDSDESCGKRMKRDSSDEDYSVSEYESHFSTRGIASRKEIDDLESAVATLHALKYCAVY
jgi:hypothetical protein